jgi:hypothetical protein
MWQFSVQQAAFNKFYTVYLKLWFKLTGMQQNLICMTDCAPWLPVQCSNLVIFYSQIAFDVMPLNTSHILYVLYIHVYTTVPHFNFGTCYKELPKRWTTDHYTDHASLNVRMSVTGSTLLWENHATNCWTKLIFIHRIACLGGNQWHILHATVRTGPVLLKGKGAYAWGSHKHTLFL